MSAHIASDTPIPTATPLTPARIGFSHSYRDEREVVLFALLLVATVAAVVAAVRAHAREVEAGAERVAVAGAHDDPDVVVTRRVAQPGDDALDQLTGERVLALGPVESQHPQVPVGLGLEHVGHGRLPLDDEPLSQCGRQPSSSPRPPSTAQGPAPPPAAG